MSSLLIVLSVVFVLVLLWRRAAARGPEVPSHEALVRIDVPERTALESLVEIEAASEPKSAGKRAGNAGNAGRPPLDSLPALPARAAMLALDPLPPLAPLADLSAGR